MGVTELDRILVFVKREGTDGRVDARELHTALGVEESFNDWIKTHLKKGNFTIDEDYDVLCEIGKGKPVYDYSLALRTAQLMAMETPTKDNINVAILRYLDHMQKEIEQWTGKFVPTFRMAEQIHTINTTYKECEAEIEGNAQLAYNIGKAITDICSLLPDNIPQSKFIADNFIFTAQTGFSYMRIYEAFKNHTDLFKDFLKDMTAESTLDFINSVTMFQKKHDVKDVKSAIQQYVEQKGSKA